MTKYRSKTDSKNLLNKVMYNILQCSNKTRSAILTLTILLFALCANGQTIDQLKSEIDNAEREIRITNELLSKTKNDKRSSQSQLKLIQSRISNRKKIVASLGAQMSIINKDISSKSESVRRLEGDLGKLKTKYADMVCMAYKNYKLNNSLLFLFSAKDFNDATRRIDYMKRYNQSREQKALQIVSMSHELSSEITALDAKKEELNAVVESRNKEIESLDKDQKQYSATVANLSTKEKQLSKQLIAKQNQINRLQQQIQNIIAEEARKNRTSNKTAAQKEYNTVLTGQFDQNKGKLPFPVRGGVIVDVYGTHPHPTQKGLMVNNKGVNIASTKGADVRSVFDGEVSRIFFFQGLNNSVMIRHGNYITVYSNLEKVSVKTGDKVSINQILGSLSESDDSDEHVLHFEIWRETQNLNPEPWLRR